MLPHEHGKLLRPTRKELQLHFQVTKTECIKHASWVMEKDEHVMKCYHRAPALHSFTYPSLPKALPALYSDSAGVQDTSYMVCFSLLN